MRMGRVPEGTQADFYGFFLKNQLDPPHPHSILSSLRQAARMRPDAGEALPRKMAKRTHAILPKQRCEPTAATAPAAYPAQPAAPTGWSGSTPPAPTAAATPQAARAAPRHAATTARSPAPASPRGAHAARLPGKVSRRICCLAQKPLYYREQTEKHDA